MRTSRASFSTTTRTGTSSRWKSRTRPGVSPRLAGSNSKRWDEPSIIIMSAAAAWVGLLGRLLIRCRVRSFEDRVQQHVAAGGQVRGLGVLDLVVADPADTRHEDHGTRRDARHIDRVVPGAADDVLMRIALRRCGITHGLDEVGVERGRREVPELPDLGLKTDRRGRSRARLPQLSVHLGQHRVIGMADIDGKEYTSGDRVARVWADLHKADRGAGVGRVRMTDT